MPPLNKHVLKGCKGGIPKKGGKAHYTASEAMRFTLARCNALPAALPAALHASLPATFHAIHLRHSPPTHHSVQLFDHLITDKNDPVWVAWQKHVAYLGPLFADKFMMTDLVALDAMIHDHQTAFDKVRPNTPSPFPPHPSP